MADEAHVLQLPPSQVGVEVSRVAGQAVPDQGLRRLPVRAIVQCHRMVPLCKEGKLVTERPGTP